MQEPCCSYDHKKKEYIIRLQLSFADKLKVLFTGELRLPKRLFAKMNTEEHKKYRGDFPPLPPLPPIPFYERRKDDCPLKLVKGKEVE